jgi:biopolymer transport protein TolR
VGGGGGGAGGGKRNVNSELNLVPFIDLLSTLICFLLITAVWQQISVLSTNTSATTASDSSSPPPPEKKIDLSVSLLLDHVETTEGSVPTKFPHIRGEPDLVSLERVLGQWKQKYPDRSDLILYSDSQAPYRHLISLMDTLSGAKFDDVGVNTN